jgi:hypothetical protein
MDCAYIDDGYTQTGYIKAEPGAHPDCLFKYRPMLSTPQYVFICELRDALPETAMALSYKVVATQIVSWDIHDRLNKQIDVKPEEMPRIEKRLFRKIRDVIAGLAVSDVMPDEPAKETAEKIYERMIDNQVTADELMAKN